MFRKYTRSGKLAQMACAGILLSAGLALSAGAPAMATEAPIYTFTGASGAYPYGPLIADASGALYGTTSYGGASLTSGNNGFGTVYKLTPPASGKRAWNHTILYSFTGLADGGYPESGVVMDAQGALYGTTYQGGGPRGWGVVYKLAPPASGTGAWTYTRLHAFGQNPDGTDNQFDATNPMGGVILNPNGAVFGTGASGGCYNGFGSVYKLKPPVSGTGPWTETIVHCFDVTTDGANTPTGDLLFDAKGAIYGTTEFGSNAAYGTVYKLTPTLGAWKETVLHRFVNKLGGWGPLSGVMLDKNGIVYGTTYWGGSDASAGATFKLSPPAVAGGQWTEEVLDVDAGVSMSYPNGRLVMDGQGKLYGTVREGRTVGGTATHMGAVFSLTPPASGTGRWTRTVLHYFGACSATGGCSCSSPSGCYPDNGLLMGADGSLYGVSTAGGPGQSNNGVVFKLTCNQWSGTGATKTCVSW
jgi:uncharacterized repeat protein (TIGR03803 family)